MIVSIVLDKPLGDTAEGTVIQVEQEVADTLISAGIAHEATAEDLGAHEESAEETPDAVTLQRSLESKVEKAATEAVEKAVEIAKKEVNRPSVKAAGAGGSRFESTDPKGLKGGFDRFGDFLVCEIAKQNGDLSAMQKMQRYERARTKGQMTVGSSTAGGSLVPQEWANELYRLSFEKTPNLLEMMTKVPMQHQTINLPSIVQPSATTGVVAAVVTEANTITDTTAVTGNVQLSLKKFSVLVNVSDELTRFNGYALESVLKQYVPERIRFQVNEDVIRGTNGGVHIAGNAATVAVSRETAGRISFNDVNAMEATMWDSYGDDYVWLTNRATMPELRRLAFPNTAASYPIPVFLPGGEPFGGMTAKPAGTLLGRPIYTCESCSGLGYEGDLIAVHLPSLYSGFLDMDASFTPFLYFDKAVNSFRFLFYAGSVNPLTQPYTRPHGAGYGTNCVILSNAAGTEGP
ncbi:MAG: phage major capsid protein [Gemmataceae bacterium]